MKRLQSSRVQRFAWAGAAILLSTLIVTCAVWRPTPPAVDPNVPAVRIELAKGLQEFRLSIDSSYAVLDSRGQVLARGDRIAAGGGRIVAGPGSTLRLNGVELGTDHVLLRAAPGAVWETAQGRYPGDLTVTHQRGTLNIENRLDLETYIAGVLFKEMPSNWPAEALRAQAVAARTYALFRMSQGREVLRATEADQVYGGVSARANRARELVRSTRGQVLMTSGKPAPAFFSSTCGGGTANGEDVLTARPSAALRSALCDHCQESPLYRWSRRLPLGEVERALGVSGLTAVRVTQRDARQRSLNVDVVSRNGSQKSPALKFRERWNRTVGGARDRQLPSSWFDELRVEGNHLVVRGRGFGHGVGLCQYGARGLAQSGTPYQRILKHYYPGAKLDQRW